MSNFRLMEQLSVIKIGGNIVDNPEALDVFLKDYAKIPGLKVLVHGGGKVATKISAALGIETQMIEGRRVTDQETVNVVTMVYAGLVNKTLVSKLQAEKCNAIGFSGADGNAIRAHKRVVKQGAVDYGFVGDVDDVNVALLSQVITDGYFPVMAPITHNGEGQLLNTNADTVASSLAVALSSKYKVNLVYCFELPGVMEDINKPETLITDITTTKYQALKSDGVIVDGMIPKMDNCYNAISKGVESVFICHANNLLGLLKGSSAIGTKLTA